MPLKKTGLFFGSFNPIHIGHLVIAGYMAEFTDMKEVWFVVSPQNPLKPAATLLSETHRLQMVRLAIEYDNRLKASKVEFGLPRPSYTIHTLTYLKEKYRNTDFCLIMGTDNLATLKKWKNYEQILRQHLIYTYPRKEITPVPPELENHASVINTRAPVMEISSSFIRKAIKDKKDVRYMMPAQVAEYIKTMHFYEK
jgi:nicotinate-nucleotide adenylyltransferase